jgi:hypothetical protein
MIAAMLLGSERAAAQTQDDYLRFEDAANTPLRNRAIETFNGYLRKVSPGARVTGCSVLIYAHPGGVEDIFGGICRLRSGATVAICADTGVGEFGLNSNVGGDKDAVAEFVRGNCPGG